MKSVKNDENVIIAGDFNNYRRGYHNDTWCLDAIGKLAQNDKFSIYTPDGGSIYEDNYGEYSFPEDHILIKGQSVKIENLYDYDRSFVDKEPNVYIWKKIFKNTKAKIRMERICMTISKTLFQITL